MSITPLLQRQPIEEEEEVLQTKTEAAEPAEVSDDLEGSIRGLSGGSHLPDPVRSFMEPRFGADFGNVRVHTGEHAAGLARSVNAHAFTVGRDIVFGAGQYDPDSAGGRQLLAHELTHVVQQGGTTLWRAAIHRGNILDEGSCEHLACNSKYACEDNKNGITCPAGTRNASKTKKYRPLFTCDTKCENNLTCSDGGDWMAIPHSRFKRSKCGQDLVICANGKFTHATVRDRSEIEAWEVSHGIQDALGVSPYAKFTGSIYGDESDAEFKKDSRCRTAKAAADAGVGDGGVKPDAGISPAGAADGGRGDAGAGSRGTSDAGAPATEELISRAVMRSARNTLQRQEEKAAGTPVAAPQPQTPIDQAKALLAESPATAKDRAAWILKAADQGFVTFNTTKARENVENVRDEKKVESMDPKAAGYSVPILEVEVGLAKSAAQRWVDANGAGDKSSVEFGSMIRSGAAGGPHAKGKAIDINALRMATTVEATITILDDLDKTIHSYYGVGLPFQGDFFDPADELTTKKAAAERSAGGAAKPKSEASAGVADAGVKPAEQSGEKPATATVRDAVVKFQSRIYQSAGTRGADGTWSWQDEVQDKEWNGAYKRLKSQTLKDALADRREDGFSFDIFPDNDNHLHLDVR